MQIIHHRVNNISQLNQIPFNHGVEVDVRYHQDHLILNHDPFNHHKNQETNFNDFLSKFKCKGPLILNLKSEGIEQACINYMDKHKVKNWFFLDMSIPLLIQYSNKAYQKISKGICPDNLAVRFSDKEPIEFALSFKGKVGWVWIDYFSILPFKKDTFSKLKKAKFKICIVSPEIQKNPFIDSLKFLKICENFEIDAVCTKDPDIWKNFKA